MKNFFSIIKHIIIWRSIDLYERYWRLKGFIEWLSKKEGIPKRGAVSSLNWYRNKDGTLITLFRNNFILKIYHNGGKNTVTYDISKRENIDGAKKYIIRS